MSNNADISNLIFLDEYIKDAEVCLGKIESAISALKKEMAERAPLESMEFGVHDLKGSSALLRFYEVESVARVMHELLARVRKDGIPVSEPILELMVKGSELLRAVVKARAIGETVEWAESLRELRSGVEAVGRESG